LGGSEGAILRTLNGGDTWIQLPSGTARYLEDVTFADANVGLAVGGSGMVLQTTDGGLTWISRQINTANWLRGVSFIDTGTAIAAGIDFFRSTDWGVTWTAVTNPAGDPLMGVTSPAESAGVAVGTAGAIFKTGDSGVTWTD
jgi:photosystem II stability/assembly factor-like uncharacterized protein